MKITAWTLLAATATVVMVGAVVVVGVAVIGGMNPPTGNVGDWTLAAAIAAGLALVFSMKNDGWLE